MTERSPLEPLLALLPESLRPYAKAVVAALPAVAYALTAVTNAVTDVGLVVPPWLAVVVAGLVALGVYEVPNEPE